MQGDGWHTTVRPRPEQGVLVVPHRLGVSSADLALAGPRPDDFTIAPPHRRRLLARAERRV